MAEKFWYLATPYSKFPRGLDVAFELASEYASRFVNARIPIFCPIAHTHPIAVFGHMDLHDLDMWLSADAPFMDAAGGLIVVQMDGWDVSVGITAEIAAFEKAGKPILYWTPGDPLPIVDDVR